MSALGTTYWAAFNAAVGQTLGPAELSTHFSALEATNESAHLGAQPAAYRPTFKAADQTTNGAALHATHESA